MKISILFIVFISTKIFIECARNYRFISLNSCTTDNEVIAGITKCEVDGTYFTINVYIKVPIVKLIVRFSD